MPVELQREILTVLEKLTVDPTTGEVRGPVTKEAVQAATALAGKLEALGFKEAAAFLRQKANEASKRVPSPPKDKQVPLPRECFSSAEQESVNRLIQKGLFPAFPKQLRRRQQRIIKVRQSFCHCTPFAIRGHVPIEFTAEAAP